MKNEYEGKSKIILIIDGSIYRFESPEDEKFFKFDHGDLGSQQLRITEINSSYHIIF